MTFFRNGCILLFLMINVPVLFSQEFTITVSDEIHHTLPADFHGIQYHSNTYNDANAVTKLDKLNIQRVRIWARVADFHPAPGIWDWAELDEKIDEVLNLDYKPAVCLEECKEWFVGTPDNPWWNHSEGLAEWENAAESLINRYQDKIDMVIVFDEPNMMYPDRDYYIHFSDAAKLFIRAANKIKSVDPNVLCGGPSAFGGWENGHWANYVLSEPDGPESLDFVSCNIFLSWHPDDSNDLIMDRTIWYEEAPLKIREMLGNDCPSTLMLDAYNVSAVWSWDGELWTDPRNVTIFGGIYQAAALLHSAKGKYEITLHWETIGGYGVLSWYPIFNELPPYYSWKFLIDVAGLVENAQLIGCTTTESPNPEAPHHGGMNVNLYKVQPFAVRRTDGGVSAILINKYSIENLNAVVNNPDGMNSYSTYRFDENRISDCFSPLEKGNTGQTVNVACPPMSVTIIRFETDSLTDINSSLKNPPESFNLFQNYPNPFNSRTCFEYSVGTAAKVQVSVYNILGQRVRQLIDEKKIAGTYKVFWDGKGERGQVLPGGIFIYKMQTGEKIFCKKMLYLK